jgi:hypothetical protein
MEPLKTIELGSCKWIGLVALACGAVAELMSLANGNSRVLSWLNRQPARSATSRLTNTR